MKAKKPDKAEQVEAALENDAVAERAGDLIAKVADKAKPERGKVDRRQ